MKVLTNQWKWIMCFMLAGVLFCGEAIAQNKEEGNRLAVINFSPSSQKPNSKLISIGPIQPRRGDQAWLSKAIGDLLIKNLSQVKSLTVLERQRMQTFIDEVEYAESALFDQEKALRVGRVGKVDRVVFGNYLLEGKQITLALFLLDLQTQQVIATEEIKGSYDQLRALIKELVLRFIDHQQILIDENEKKKIQFQITDSMTATEHFYKGIDFYDQGEYPEAFGEFLGAIQQDTKYFEAHLWVGKMFEAQKFYTHAALAYQKLYQTYPQSIEAVDALLFAANVYELQLNNSDKAISIYKEITTIRPKLPHSLVAYFQLGELYRQSNLSLEAYMSLQEIDQFKEKADRNPDSIAQGERRTSRFVTWKNTLRLYRESIAKMILIYPQVVSTITDENLPKAPRGVIMLDANDPHYSELKFNHTPSLFKEEFDHDIWKERYYVVVVPEGYVATGVDIKTTGVLKVSSVNNSFITRVLPFPLPRDPDRFWLGATYGQTMHESTVAKSVSFFGKHQKIFALQFIENNSIISKWEIKANLRLEKEMKASKDVSPMKSNHFWEGKPVAQIPIPENGSLGATRKLSQTYYQSKKEIDIRYIPQQGYWLVTNLGELDGQQTDLWMAHSSDGIEWGELKYLPINSSSGDYNPRLIHSEDNKLWLTWLSNRRGKGWELWMSALLENNTWSNPSRVPLEKFFASGMESRHKDPQVVLEYDVYQDSKGQWIVAYYSLDTKKIVLIKSSDFLTWELLADIDSEVTSYGLSLVQDSSDVYRLAYLGFRGKLNLLRSVDGLDWTKNEVDVKLWKETFVPTPKTHRIRLFPLEMGHLLITVSDNMYGLQFAKFHGDSAEPLLDLVTRAGLEAYGMTKGEGDNYFVSFKETDKIVIRQYKNFNIRGEPIEKDTRNWPIYKEIEKDTQGNQWMRIFSQARNRMSDVTSLGIESSGRVWWGIESGMMYKHGEHFLATDVSLGFFNNFVTNITSCSDKKVWFSSHALDKPELGFVAGASGVMTPLNKMRPKFQKVTVVGVRGAITDVACVGKADQIFIATDQGDVAKFDGKNIFAKQAINLGHPVTSLAYDQNKKVLWIGTKQEGLYRIEGGDRKVFKKGEGLVSNHIVDLVIDQDGALWVSVYGEGLMRFKDNKWEHFTPENSPINYWSIDRMAGDKKKGIWFLPHDDVVSQGIAYFDGNKGVMVNPPYNVFNAPSSIVVEDEDTLWIGSWFDGVYQLKLSPR